MLPRLKKNLTIPERFFDKVQIYHLWMVLIVIAAAIALWFSSIAAYKMVNYFRYNQTSQAQITKWGIKELSPSHYAIEAFFEFQTDGQRYHGKTSFESPVYLNPFTAEYDIKKKDSEPRTVWYRASNPSFSTLEKRFPMKPFIHALVPLGVVLYFYFIRRAISLEVT